ncbi:hypothetical protein B0A55_10494 [Friedmanniomyces simplex]|uniref:Tyrosinase copper-binding domain-containing protein n=1 Tax=Friedmanniomyces simplex TaxID=329884 RepID=A0A4U0WRY2_9PEZI|nr:hypothetical protein B0A55_10494 [Friedmanniomyces simplex]
MRSGFFGVILACVTAIVANPTADEMLVARTHAAEGDRLVLGAGKMHVMKRAEEENPNPDLCCDYCKRADDEYLQSVKAKREAAGEDFSVMEITASTFEEYFKIPFIGNPEDGSVDKDWEAFMISMSPSDLDKAGISSIDFPGRPGQYIARLGVYHELHCLNGLRKATWRDFYHPNMTETEAWMERAHSEHCIEFLRQAIMCRADTALV